MDDLGKLQYLYLVSKICTEFENHLGLTDKVSAEFVIDLADKHSSIGDFNRALLENGAEFPEAFVANLYNIIQKIRPHKPSNTNKQGEGNGGEGGDDEKGRLEMAKVKSFPALAMPNGKPEWQVKEEETLKQRSSEEGDGGGVGDSCLVKGMERIKLEDIEDKEKERDRDHKGKDREKERDRDRDRDRRDRDRDRDDRDRRERDRDRDSRDKERDRDNRDKDRDRDRDNRDNRDKDRDRRRWDKDDKGYDRRREREEEERYVIITNSLNSNWIALLTMTYYRRRPVIDDEPILYKIYDGKVSKTMDFGAFVSLEGVKGRREGLVHVTQLKVCQ